MAKKKSNYSGGSYVPRKPDFDVCVLDKNTDERAKVGGGWLNEKGQISIKLNLCTVIHAREGLVITLFPTDDIAAALVQPKPPESASTPVVATVLLS